ncbi:MAG: hypothetical protein HY900_09520 [Deltaproteobacteria bacterium]|nr:hypothetical protein [Deltaproteobacteria bacterium]
MKKSIQKAPVLKDRIPTAISLPESFLESIFTGFSVMRDGREVVCIRYSMGSEEKRSFLPFYDHRPQVIAAANSFDRDPSPPNALELLKALGSAAEVEVKRRAVAGEASFFVNFWPTDERWPEMVLSGTENDLKPHELEKGLSASGTEALWYWVGILPLERDDRGDRGLKVVHISLIRRPAEAPSRGEGRRGTERRRLR